MESAVVTSLAERPQFDGSWRPCTGDPFEVVNPARGQPLATLASSTSEDVSAALSAARRAQPAWSRRPPIEWGDLLRSIADVFAANRTLLQDLLVSEIGKPAAQAASEVAFAEAFLRYNAGWDRHLEGEILADDVADFRESGIGGEDGKWAILHYTQIKTADHLFGGSDQVSSSPHPIGEARTGRSEAR
jgi:acyl-CoA reductase-like NAD-dependent aldehyde dehydrogenase